MNSPARGSDRGYKWKRLGHIQNQEICYSKSRDMLSKIKKNYLPHIKMLNPKGIEKLEELERLETELEKIEKVERLKIELAVEKLEELKKLKKIKNKNRTLNRKARQNRKTKNRTCSKKLKN